MHTFMSLLDMISPLTGSGSGHIQEHGEDLKPPENTQLDALKLSTKLGLMVQACHTNYLEVWGRMIEFKAYLGQRVSSRPAWAT